MPPAHATLTGLALTKDFKSWIRAGWLTDPLLDDRDAILFPEKVNGKHVLLHRPLEWVGPAYGTDQACAWIALADDLLGFPAAPSRLLIKRRYPWEAFKWASIPPLSKPRTVGSPSTTPSDPTSSTVGGVLLDLEDPGIVRHRTPDWLLQPEGDHELEGFYPWVLFSLRGRRDRWTLFVYYGGADKYRRLATCDFQQLLAGPARHAPRSPDHHRPLSPVDVAGRVAGGQAGLAQCRILFPGGQEPALVDHRRGPRVQRR